MEGGSNGASSDEDRAGVPSGLSLVESQAKPLIPCACGAPLLGTFEKAFGECAACLKRAAVKPKSRFA